LVTSRGLVGVPPRGSWQPGTTMGTAHTLGRLEHTRDPTGTANKHFTSAVNARRAYALLLLRWAAPRDQTFECRPETGSSRGDTDTRVPHSSFFLTRVITHQHTPRRFPRATAPQPRGPGNRVGRATSLPGLLHHHTQDARDRLHPPASAAYSLRACIPTNAGRREREPHAHPALKG